MKKFTMMGLAAGFALLLGANAAHAGADRSGNRAVTGNPQRPALGLGFTGAAIDPSTAHKCYASISGEFSIWKYDNGDVCVSDEDNVGVCISADASWGWSEPNPC